MLGKFPSTYIPWVVLGTMGQAGMSSLGGTHWASYSELVGGLCLCNRLGHRLGQTLDATVPSQKSGHTKKTTQSKADIVWVKIILLAH
ncbi:hypothetical protein LY78DRAFT_251440 [Colletotrichum sublineola]|nr:hypothetical protein LY78DRAFT_251440 [Colletotrichum sublineola]